MKAFRDLAQADRAMIAGVHRRHARQQCLRGADVTGGFFAANVLLAGLQGKPQGGAAARILGNTHDPARHTPFEGIARGKEGRMRAAVAQWDANPLRAAKGDVRADPSWRPKQRQAQQIRRYRYQGARRMCLFDETGVVKNLTERVRVLDQRAENPVTELESLVVPGHNLNAQGLGPGSHHVYGLRMARLGDAEDISFFFQWVAQG